jgi:enoyl-CoA hydratase
MDDGKANVLSSAMLAELNAALDRALAHDSVVVLTGRPGIFSAGFDLTVLQRGGSEAAAMVLAGFATAERLLSFPTPVVAACGGHAVAMGVFLLLAADYRIGTQGVFTIAANEVAIGLAMPRAAVEIMRQRVTPSCFHRAVALAEAFDPDTAVQAGLLDRVVHRDELLAVAHDMAHTFGELDLPAHQTSKLRARASALSALRVAILADAAELHGRPAPAVL